MIRPLLSIVIPTRNRQKYAALAVKSILKICDPRLEIIVQDNSDIQTLDKLIDLTDCRLKYQYSPPPLSITGNFEKAIRLSTGKYICMIGDDDGVNPEILQATEWAEYSQAQALVGSLSANYRWAGTGAPNTLFTKMTDSTLIITHFTGRTRYVDTEVSLRAFAKSGLTYYLDFDLPKFYHGIVRRDVLDQVLHRTGAYINGLSTDIYLSVAIATLIRSTVVIDYPLTLPGVCNVSSSIQEGQIKKHSTLLDDAPHLRSNLAYAWNNRVPPLYTVETLWTESALHALSDMNRSDLLKQFDSYRMYANIISANPNVSSQCIRHIKLASKSENPCYVKLLIAFVLGPLKRFIQARALSRFLIILRIRRFKQITGLHDICDAVTALSIYIKSIRKRIDHPPFAMISTRDQ